MAYRVLLCFLVLAVTGLWAMPFGDFEHPLHWGMMGMMPGMGMGMAPGMGMGMAPGMGMGMGMPGYGMGMGAYNPMMGSFGGMGMNPLMMSALLNK